MVAQRAYLKMASFLRGMNTRFNVGSLEREFTRSSSAITLSNWEYVLETFLARWSEDLPISEKYIIRAYVARLLEVAYGIYVLNGYHPQDFKNDFVVFADRFEGAMTIFHDDTDHIQLPKKRLPSLSESVDATIQRFEVMEDVKALFESDVESIIVGGSVAYGPFLNVRSDEESSDIDFIVVVNSDFFEKDSVRPVDDKLMSEKEWQIFLERKKVFLSLYKNSQADTMSHKFEMVHSDHTISFHFFPKDVFEKIYLSQVNYSSLDDLHIIKSYRSRKSTKEYYDLLDFEGRQFDYPLEYAEAKLGWVVYLPSSGIKNGRYMPGFYHQMIMPSHYTIFDRDEYAKRTVDLSLDKMKKRVMMEKTERPSSSFINSHPRKPIFAPGKYDKWEEQINK